MAPKIHPKRPSTRPKRHKKGTKKKHALEMPPGIPKVSQNGPKMEPKWTQDGAKMEPKWFQDGAKIVPEGSKAQDTSRDRKSDPKSTIIPPN